MLRKLYHYSDMRLLDFREIIIKKSAHHSITRSLRDTNKNSRIIKKLRFSNYPFIILMKKILNSNEAFFVTLENFFNNESKIININFNNKFHLLRKTLHVNYS